MRNFRETLVVGASESAISPDPILDLVAQNPQATTIDLVWSEPELNGSTLINYVIQRQTPPSTAYTNIGQSTGTSFTDTGLTPETLYRYRVRAVSVEGEGPNGLPAEVETTPNIPLFNEAFAFFAAFPMDTVYLVGIDAATIEQNGTVVATLTAGQTTTVSASQFDVFIGTGAFHAIGQVGNGWFELNPNYTVGKRFAYGPTRNNPQQVFVYAFQDSNVNVEFGGSVVGTQFIAANSGHQFTYNGINATTIIDSDGLIMVAQGSNTSIDQTPLLPVSREIIGVPSNSARVYPSEPMTYWGCFRADGNPFGGGGHETTAQEGNIDGTGSQYSGDGVLVQANNGVSGASFADSDGAASAPFLPTTLMRTRYGIPFIVERIKFVGTEPFSVTTSNGNTYNSAGSGAVQDLNITATADRAEGTLFTASIPVGAWSEPDIGDQDEFILFGF